MQTSWKIRILLANKKQGAAKFSQAVVCVTLGDVSPICFRKLSVLVKMVSVGFHCSTSTGSVGVSIPVILHVSQGTCWSARVNPRDRRSAFEGSLWPTGHTVLSVWCQPSLCGHAVSAWYCCNMELLLPFQCHRSGSKDHQNVEPNTS